jgi:kynurenine formamidase
MTRTDLDLENLEAVDLSIPLRFNGHQPNAWGVERATSRPVVAGDLIGDTRRGGSVNFEQYTFIPHCSGTHTECVGHITHERISIRGCLKDILIPAILVSVESDSGDRPITRAALESAIDSLDKSDQQFEALIIRTLPNGDWKLTAEYGEDNIPAYFSPGAIDLIVELGVNHILVDLPSVDRIFDEGKLVNHRKFWNVEPDGHEVNSETRLNSTITELIYVPDPVEDGEYLLNLQIAPFDSDCSPSRPILIRKT